MEQHIKSLLSQEEIDLINIEINKIKESSEISIWHENPGEQQPEVTKTHKIIHNTHVGKIMFDINVPDSVKIKVQNIASENGFILPFHRAAYAEYSAEWGTPELVDHLDSAELFMVDYQLSSNTNWGLVIDGNLYDLKDNEGITFLPKKQMHGRPEKVFKDGEYVRMLFLEVLI